MARAPPPPLPEHLPPPGALAGPRKEESPPTVGVEASGDGGVARGGGGGGGRAAGVAGLLPPPVAPLWPWPPEPPPAASGSGGSLAALARPFQKAEALLRHHRLLLLRPGLRRLLPRSAAAAASEHGSSSSSSGEEESDSEPEPEGTPSSSCGARRRLAAQQLAQVERSFAGLSRCLCVQEDPRTETFQGHLRPQEEEEDGAGRPPPAAAAAFSFHPARACLSRRGAALHALLQQRHRLRLARRFSRRLQAASAFVGRLQALAEEEEEEGAAAARLLGLCEELHTHTGHWEGLRRHLSSNSGPWPRAALLGQRPEAVVRHMKRALLCLALHAARLLEVCLEARLRGLARRQQQQQQEPGHYPGTGPPPTQRQLGPDLFQAVQLYNQAVSDRTLRRTWAALPAESQAGSGTRRRRGPPGGAPFTLERVSALLAGERGRLAGERLARLLLGRPGEEGPPPPLPWEGPEESWFSGDDDAQGGPRSAELQTLCREEEGALRDLLRDLVASSTDSLWLRVLRRPRPGMKLPEGPPRGAEPAGGLPTLKTLRWLDASFAEAAAELHGQCCPLLWRVAASTLACRLERHPPRAALAATAGAAALGQRLICTLAEGHLPCESAEELRALGLHLLLRDVFCHWDQGFCLALGSSLTEKCTVKPGAQDTEAACSRTARCLQSLCRPLSFSLRCLDPPSSGNTGHHLLSASLRLKLLSLAVATSHTSCYWVMSKAHEYLASWSLSQFLLVTQGDLQVLKMETKKMWVLVGEAFPEEGGGGEHPPLISGQEQELSRQVHTMTTSIHLFTEKVLGLFSLDCKRMSLEIFEQTMPLGKHWRLALRTELPTSPSEYASAAAQTVLGQVLQGLRLLPREAQGLALSTVTTAFLEAWMDHILAQKIKFSLQGALQLKQDFDLVRSLLQSEDSGLSLEIRQWVLSLRVFQQMDNAIACLLQQPGRASLPSNSWGAFHNCCSFNGLRTPLESGSSGPGSLNSLESLEGLPAQGGMGSVLESPVGDLLSRRHGGGCSPETYLSPTQQEWLALRLHGGHRWRVPTLPCMDRLSES